MYFTNRKKIFYIYLLFFIFNLFCVTDVLGAPGQPDENNTAQTGFFGIQAATSEVMSGGNIDFTRPNDFRVSKYNLDLMLIPAKHMISGEVEITPDLNYDNASEITLYLHQDMDVRALKLMPSNYEVSFKRVFNKIVFNTAGRSFSRIYVSFYGDPSVYLTQKNSFSYIGSEGCYLNDECLYFPRADTVTKTAAEMNVLVPEGWTPVTQGYSNERSGSVVIGNDRYSIFNFKTAFNSRCHTLAAGPYVKKDSRNIECYFFENDEEYCDIYIEAAEKILLFYKSKLGKLPFNNLKIVEVEKVFPGGYGPREVVYITAAAVEKYEKSADLMLLSHEIAHQWFGNYVTGDFNGSNFMNEAFATYMSLEFLNDISTKKPEYITQYDNALTEIERGYFAYKKSAGTNEISVSMMDKANGFGPGYQEVIYYRGALILKMLFNQLGAVRNAVPNIEPANFIKKYADKVVTTEDFINFMEEQLYGEYVKTSFDKTFNRIYSPAGDHVSSKNSAEKMSGRSASGEISPIRYFFNEFYNSTEVVKLTVNGFEIIPPEEKSGQYTINYDISRNDGIKADIWFQILFEGEPEAGTRKKDNFYLAPGSNVVTFKTNFKPLKWTIDPDKKILMDRNYPALTALTESTDSVAIYGTVSKDSRVNSFMGEFAKSYYRSPIDDQTAAADVKKSLAHERVFIIGSPENNAVLNLIKNYLPCQYYKYSVKIDGKSYFDESYAVKYVFQNPFFIGGVISVVSFDSPAALSKISGLSNGLNDYVLDISGMKEKAYGNFNSNLNGIAVQNREGKVEIVSTSVGFNNYVVTDHINPVIVKVSNTCHDTQSVTLKFKFSNNPDNFIFEGNFNIAPDSIENIEVPVYFSIENNDYSLKFVLYNSDGAEISWNNHSQVNKTRNKIYLVCANDAESFKEIKSVIVNSYYSNKSSLFPKGAGGSLNFEIINADIGNFPLKPLMLDGIDALVLYNTELGGMPDGFKDTVLKYAVTGGKVIIAGRDYSKDFSNLNLNFFENIFLHTVKSSRLFESKRKDSDQSGGDFGVDDGSSANGADYTGADKPNLQSKKETAVKIKGSNPEALAGGHINKYGGFVIKADDSRVLWSQVGGGVFTYISYNMASWRLSPDDDDSRLLENSLFSKTKNSNKYFQEPFKCDDVMKYSMEKLMPDTDFIMIFFAAYALFIGPILVFTIVRLKAQNYYIIAQFGVVVVFTLLVFIAGFCFRQFKSIVEIVAVAEIPQNYCGSVKKYNTISVRTMNSEAAEYNFPAAAKFVISNEYCGYNRYYSSRRRINISGEKNGSTKVIFEKPFSFEPNFINLIDYGLELSDGYLNNPIIQAEDRGNGIKITIDTGFLKNVPGLNPEKAFCIVKFNERESSYASITPGLKQELNLNKMNNNNIRSGGLSDIEKMNYDSVIKYYQLAMDTWSIRPKPVAFIMYYDSMDVSESGLWPVAAQRFNILMVLFSFDSSKGVKIKESSMICETGDIRGEAGLKRALRTFDCRGILKNYGKLFNEISGRYTVKFNNENDAKQFYDAFSPESFFYDGFGRAGVEFDKSINGSEVYIDIKNLLSCIRQDYLRKNSNLKTFDVAVPKYCTVRLNLNYE